MTSVVRRELKLDLDDWGQYHSCHLSAVGSFVPLLTFPRYSHNIGEEGVNGQSLPLTAVVALLSRRVVVQGNVTKERISHVRECAEAGGTRGEKVLRGTQE